VRPSPFSSLRFHPIWLASQFTQDNPRAAPNAHLSMASISRPVSPHDNVNPLKFSTEQAGSTSFPGQVSEPRDSNDPLAEFYELAKAERDNDVRSGPHSRLLPCKPTFLHRFRNMKMMLLETRMYLKTGKQMMSTTERLDLRLKE
jgi:hypothetical protein